MKIAIIGLGLIGASYAQGLSKKHDVYGWDIDQEILKKATEEERIKGSVDIKDLSSYQAIIMCLYPKDNIKFIKQYGHKISKDQLLTDVSGTKKYMFHEMSQYLPKEVTYISMHPMAGKALSGYQHHDASIFKNANLIVVPYQVANQELKRMILDIYSCLEFKQMIELTADTHDQLIAFTSQLTHAIAVALVNADSFLETARATGDSYRDLTRIANINAKMWAELFLENKEALIGQIDRFTEELNKVRSFIETTDQETLEAYLNRAKEKRVSFDKN